MPRKQESAAHCAEAEAEPEPEQEQEQEDEQEDGDTDDGDGEVYSLEDDDDDDDDGEEDEEDMEEEVQADADGPDDQQVQSATATARPSLRVTTTCKRPAQRARPVATGRGDDEDDELLPNPAVRAAAVYLRQRLNKLAALRARTVYKGTELEADAAGFLPWAPRVCPPDAITSASDRTGTVGQISDGSNTCQCQQSKEGSTSKEGSDGGGGPSRTAGRT